MSEYAYVYIMASSFRKLYIGLTTEIEIRVRQHKNHTNPNCHTATYSIHDLVYFERFSSILAAIRRERFSKAGCASASSSSSLPPIPSGKTSARTGAGKRLHSI